MEMKTRLPFLLLTVALVALLAACGGGGSGSVPDNAIAKVGSTPITKATFNSLLDFAFARYKAQGQAPPKVGTPTYTQLKDSATAFLVQQVEFAQEGEKIGVTVTQKDIDQQIATIRKSYYKGSEKKLEAALKKDHITLSELEQFKLRPDLLGQKLQAKLTSNVKVSDAAALKYYNQNKATYSTPAQTTRSVAHILVKTKAEAEKLEKKLQNGASFASLAKRYSTDTGSAQNGGKLTAVKGQLVKPFQDVAFSLKTGKISQPVHSQFGWHIIEALGPVKNTPAHTQSFKEVKATIESTLAAQKKQTAFQNWLTKVQNDYKGKVSYQTGYAPSTTTTPTTPAPTTTG
jgi:foldase protein PrsA